MLVLLSEPDAWFGLGVYPVVLCYQQLVAALLKQKLVNIPVTFDLSTLHTEVRTGYISREHIIRHSNRW